MVRLVASGDFNLLAGMRSSCLSEATTVDVRFRCSDHGAADGLGAHKLILASASPNFLKGLLSIQDGREDEMICVHLPDYRAEDVASVVSLLYCGELLFSDIVTLDVCQKIMRDLGISVSIAFDYEDNLYKIVNSNNINDSGKSPARVVKRESETFECSRCNFFTNEYDVFTHHSDLCSQITAPLKVERTESANEDDCNISEDDLAEEHDVDVDFSHRCSYLNCRFSSESLSAFQVHQEVHNRRESRKNCPLCREENFLTLKELHRHINLQHSRENNGCSYCDWIPVCGTRDPLYKHVLNRHSEALPRLRCELCNYSSESSSHLSRHLKTHNNEKFFECSVCSSTFKTNYQLTSHRSAVHDKKKEHECKTCTKSFSTGWQLRLHLKSHKNSSYKCKKCGKIFRKSQSLAGHVNSAHPELRRPKTVICEACGRGFRTRSQLEDHQCGTSTVQKRHCDICDKDIPVNSFKAHRQYHDCAKISCDSCNKVFANNSSLVRHKLIHSDNKPWKCSVCSKEFRQKSALKTHFKIHTGERLSCSSCGKRFISKSLLNHHYRVSDCDKIDNLNS